jgi:hypothetical protein
VEKLAGAEPATIQADITRAAALDDNLSQVELRKVADTRSVWSVLKTRQWNLVYA